MKSSVLIRLTRMPAKIAASWLAPIAKSDRPNGVKCRTTPKHDREDQEDQHGVRTGRCAGPVLMPMFVYAGREVRDRVRAEDDHRDPAVERERPDRHGERREPEPRDQQAVEGAGDDADDENGRDDRRHRPAVAPEVADERARQPERRSDREVDLAGDDDERQRQRHHRDLADRDAEIEEVAAGQELRRRDDAEQDHADRGQRQPRLPANERQQPRAVARSGGVGVGSLQLRLQGATSGAGPPSAAA